MKILACVASAIVVTFAMTSTVLAGGVAGGGGPPALEALRLIKGILPEEVPLVFWSVQSNEIGVDAPLTEVLNLAMQDSDVEDAPFSELDDILIKHKARKVEVFNLNGLRRSYRILRTNSKGQLLLIDRRLLLRASLKYSEQTWR